MADPTPSPTPSPSQKPPRTGSADWFNNGPSASPSASPSGSPTAQSTTQKTGQQTIVGTGVPPEQVGNVWLNRPAGTEGTKVSYNTGTVGQDFEYNQQATHGWVTKSDAMDAFTLIPPQEQNFFNQLAALAGHNSTGESQYKRYVTQAAIYSKNGQRLTPYDVALQDLKRNGIPTPSGGNGSGGSGSGPRTTSSVSFMDKGSAEMLLNKLAVDKLGRNLTDQELKKYTAEFHSQEAKNPTVTTSSTGSSVSQQGMADADIANKILMNNPSFSDNVLKTDVVDMFLNRIGGKNG